MKFVFQKLNNLTKEDLTFTFDGASYSVKAGQSDIFPDFVSRQGAKILTDREWKAPLDLVGRKKMEDSFLGELQNDKSETKKLSLTEEILLEKDELQKSEALKKNEVNEVKKEEEFEDLKLKNKCEVCGFEAKSHAGLSVHKLKHVTS